MSRTKADSSVVSSASEVIRNCFGGLSELSFLDRNGAVDILETASLQKAASGAGYGAIEFVSEGISGNGFAQAAEILLALEPFSANELQTPTAQITKSSSGKRGRAVASQDDALNAWNFLVQAKGIEGVAAEFEEEDGRVYFSTPTRKLSYSLRRKGVAGSTLVETALLVARLIPYARPVNTPAEIVAEAAE